MSQDQESQREARFISDQLAKAKTQAGAGKYKGAVATLWFAEAAVRSGDHLDSAGEMLALAREVTGKCSGSAHDDCAGLIVQLQEIMNRGVQPALLDGAIGYVPDCFVIAAAGIPVDVDVNRSMTLVFREDRIVLAPTDHLDAEDAAHVDWDGLELSIEGAGEVRSGGGFIGGGFGLVGMAAGMLTAGALNALTSKTGIETIVHLQTQQVELYLYHGQMTPEVLRRALAPVFLHLRQLDGQKRQQPEESDDHVVDRLHKLASLLDRGLIDEGEFATLKAELLDHQ